MEKPQVAFNRAVKYIIKNEGDGKYTNQRNDWGGPTRYGLSRRFLKSIHSTEPLLRGVVIDVPFIREIKEDFATYIYRKYFWIPCKAADLNDEVLAIKYVDMCVPSGQGNGTECLQKAINKKCSGLIVVDGIIGPKTIAAANSFKESVLWLPFADACTAYFKSLGNDTMTNGWVKRAIRLP